MGGFFEDINRATPEYPYIKISNYNMDYINHIHEETEVICVLEGELDVVVGCNRLTLYSGDICIIIPGQVHNLIAEKYNKVCIMKLYNHMDLSGLRLESNIVTKSDSAYGAIKDFIDTIIREDFHRERGYKSAVNIAAWQIQLFVFRDIPHIEISRNEIKKINKKIQLVSDVNTYLEQDFPKNVSLENVAGYCGYTKYYFSHYFKDTMGMGFWDYYSFFRIKKAAFMIGNSDNSITQIAQDCGFSSLRSFNRMFQKYLNCSPREYRNK